jgi:hypothetical protein
MMVKMGKLVQKFKNHFLGMNLKKIVKQITSSKNALNYRSNQPLFPESMAR